VSLVPGSIPNVYLLSLFSQPRSATIRHGRRHPPLTAIRIVFPWASVTPAPPLLVFPAISYAYVKPPAKVGRCLSPAPSPTHRRARKGVPAIGRPRRPTSPSPHVRTELRGVRTRHCVFFLVTRIVFAAFGWSSLRCFFFAKCVDPWMLRVVITFPASSWKVAQPVSDRLHHLRPPHAP